MVVPGKYLLWKCSAGPVTETLVYVMINKIVIHFIIVQAHFLLSSTTQVSMGPLSMLSKVWFTNAHCIYWNKNQVKNVLTYNRNRIKGEVIFSIWDVSIWLLELSKVFKAVGFELFIVKKPKKNYRYFSSELFLTWMFWSPSQNRRSVTDACAERRCVRREGGGRWR